MSKVIFCKLTEAKYNSLSSRDDGTMYFLTDKGVIMVGGKSYSGNAGSGGGHEVKTAASYSLPQVSDGDVVYFKPSSAGTVVLPSGCSRFTRFRFVLDLTESDLTVTLPSGISWIGTDSMTGGTAPSVPAYGTYFFEFEYVNTPTSSSDSIGWIGKYIGFIPCEHTDVPGGFSTEVTLNTLFTQEYIDSLATGTTVKVIPQVAASGRSWDVDFGTKEIYLDCSGYADSVNINCSGFTCVDDSSKLWKVTGVVHPWITMLNETASLLTIQED